jgi:Ca2+-binding RTX toxin-like protein
MRGNELNDIIFGGPDADSIFGDDGNDMVMAGPDRPGAGQIIRGNAGNDTANVFAGEVSECLVIFGDPGRDVTNLIGFGPFSAEKPYGRPDLTGPGYIVLNDPIAGGLILIFVDFDDNSGSEVINGLLSPNVTFIPGVSPTEVSDCNDTIPNGFQPPTL